jgi:glycerophosphoryl diester phosphodiesterase
VVLLARLATLAVALARHGEVDAWALSNRHDCEVRREVAGRGAASSRASTSGRRERPLVIAHRGASISAPEHTLAAYRTALEQGADGVECDVRLTADGHLVCVHDRRVDRTSNGVGVVSTLELADLESLDFAARAAAPATADGVDPDVDRSGVLTLERLLRLVCDHGRPLEIAIETKHPTRYAGLVERRVVETLRSFDLLRPSTGRPTARVMSFSPIGLRRVRDLAADLPTVLLMDRLPLRLRDGRLPVGVSVAGPSIEVLREHPAYVQRAHARGHRVHVWTVNASEDVAHCHRLGVDAIITDRPLATRTLLASMI